MAKPRTVFLCRECGASHPQWLGRCPDCGTWDALERYTPPAATGEVATITAETAGPPDGATPLPEVATIDVERRETGIGELDRVLGGGLVPGSVVLVGGDPGIGKSTLLLQAAIRLAGSGSRILYVSSEESALQTRMRAERLIGSGDLESLSELLVLADTQLVRIAEHLRSSRPHVCIIDSIQMIHSSAIDASPGSVTQLRRCCADLVQFAKTTGTAILIVGHVTKDGQLAGPKLLEHLVDTVVSFEGDRYHAHRVVRCVKNRFGTTLEVGLFEMTGRGLEEVAELRGPLSPAHEPAPGAVICPVMQGTRSLLIEIQALTATGFLGNAKRKTSGLDSSRLAMLIAVLEKHGGLRLADQDVFTSAVGGLRVVEPGADLALALAIAGAHLGRGLAAGVAVVGEVGLGGEIRPVHHLAQRALELRRLGFGALLTAPGAGEAPGIELIEVARVEAALEHLGAALVAR